MISNLPWRVDGWQKERTSGLILDNDDKVVAICPNPENAAFILECVTKQTTERQQKHGTIHTTGLPDAGQSH